MKAVMHDVGVRHGLSRADDEGAPHVHRRCDNLVELILRQCHSEFYPSIDASIWHDFQHAPPVQLGHQGHIALAPQKALLIQAHARDAFGRATGQPYASPPHR
jgi:hypothetical protein